MFFPWVGMLEQIRLADVFVHYDDVAFSKGSYSNRVQLKVASGVRWLTLPLKNVHMGQKIDEVLIQPPGNWSGKNRHLLQESLASATFFQDALELSGEAGFTRGELEAYDRYWDIVSSERTLLSGRFNEGRSEGKAETEKALVAELIAGGMSEEDAKRLIYD